MFCLERLALIHAMALPYKIGRSVSCERPIIHPSRVGICLISILEAVFQEQNTSFEYSSRESKNCNNKTPETNIRKRKGINFQNLLSFHPHPPSYMYPKRGARVQIRTNYNQGTYCTALTQPRSLSKSKSQIKSPLAVLSPKESIPSRLFPLQQQNQYTKTLQMHPHALL